MTDDVYSFDDLALTIAAGRPSLRCPVCGALPVPQRAPTLSDFTNAAIEHLAEVHLVSQAAGAKWTAAA